MALIRIDPGLAGEVFELAEANKLAGIDNRDLLVLLAVKDEQRWQALYLGKELIREKTRPLGDGSYTCPLGTSKQGNGSSQVLSHQSDLLIPQARTGT